MAFPTIPTVAGNKILFQLATNPAGTHTSPSLTTLDNDAGDLMIAICIIYDGNSTNAEFSSWGGGFTEFGDFASTTGVSIGCAYKVADGTETGTFTVTSSDTSANDSCFILLSIPGAHASTAPEAGGFAQGTESAPDPGTLNPSGWDVEDTLWIAVAGLGEVSTGGAWTGLSAAPSGWTGYADSGVSADAVGAIEGAVAFLQSAAASVAPGAFSSDTSNVRWGSCIIAVRPIASTAHTVDPPDTLTLSDARTFAFGKSAADSLAPTDSLSRVHAAARTPADSVVLADQAATAKAIPKAVSDSATLADAVTIDWVLDRSSSSTIALSDSLSRVHEAARTPADSLTLADELTKVSEIARTLADTLALADSSTHARGLAAADSLSLTDEATPDHQVGGTSHERQIDDTLALTDQLSRVLEIARSLADDAALSDAITHDRASAIADSLALADELTRAVEALRTLADSLTLADEATPDLTVAGEHEVTPEDALALADQLSRVVEFARALADSVALADALAFASDHALADTVSLADSQAVAIDHAIADTVALADETTPELATGHTRQIDDTLTLADSFARQLDQQRLNAEQLALADLLARAVTSERSFDDSVALIDELTSFVPQAVFDPPTTGWLGVGSPGTITASATSGRISRPLAGRTV